MLWKFTFRSSTYTQTTPNQNKIIASSFINIASLFGHDGGFIVRYFKGSADCWLMAPGFSCVQWHLCLRTGQHSTSRVVDRSYAYEWVYVLTCVRIVVLWYFTPQLAMYCLHSVRNRRFVTIPSKESRFRSIGASFLKFFWGVDPITTWPLGFVFVSDRLSDGEIFGKLNQ